tara:strand:- start:1143 stop:2315 length:1173 start_codon:yes stop_codon:yes gene_type:complete
MSNFIKFKKSINRALLKLKKDKKNLHLIDIPNSYIKKNFNFNYNENNLSDNGIKRIFSFAEHMRDKIENSKKKDMWNNIVENRDHKNLLDYCLNKNKKKFLELILSAGKTNLVHGFLTWLPYKKLFSSNKAKYKESMLLLDKLISLSEYRKLIKVFNPEQGGWIAEDLDYNKLVEQIFTFNNKKISPFQSPNYTFGFNSNKEFYSFKDFKMFYTSLRLNELFNIYGLKEVNEIGAGLGYTAYYFSRINHNIYNIYDLPTVLILQAYFIMSSIGESKVYLSGENKNKDSQISLYPYWEIFNKNDNKDSLWINQDSFPEIDFDLAKNYIKKIMQSKNSYLLSINQEARNDDAVGGKQHAVYDLLNLSENFKLIYRSRDFLRLGYIEELYSIN